MSGRINLIGRGRADKRDIRPTLSRSGPEKKEKKDKGRLSKKNKKRSVGE